MVQTFEDGFSLKSLIFAFFITKTDNWFFPAYLWLMFLTPFINSCVSNLESKKLKHSVIFFVLMSVVSGWLLHHNANPSGYTVLHLVLIYMIGALISKEKKRVKNYWYLVTYVACSILNALICYLIVNKAQLNGMFAFHYNSPFVIMAAISFFLFFEGLEIKSKSINKIAATVVAMLFIQDVVLRRLMVSQLKEKLATGGVEFIASASLWLIFFFLAAFVVEIVRRPIANKIVSHIEKRLPSKWREINFN